MARLAARGYRSAQERREHALAAWLSGTVRIALAVALTVCAIQSYGVLRVHAPLVSLPLRLSLPVVLALGAVLSLRGGVRSVREAREVMATEVASPPDGGLDGPA